MRTASLEAKLLHHLTEMGEEVFYKFFLNLQKVYDALNVEQCIEIIMGYGVGLWKERILWH